MGSLIDELQRRDHGRHGLNTERVADAKQGACRGA